MAMGPDPNQTYRIINCVRCGDDYEKPRHTYCPHCLKNKLYKLCSIKEMGCICPGCLIDFSGSNEFALDMIFEECHIHSKACRAMRGEDESYYFACRACNIKQHNPCGKFENGVFLWAKHMNGAPQTGEVLMKMVGFKGKTNAKPEEE
jgi:hypothetical protein